MKRSELRSGMLIEFTDNSFGLVMLNTPTGDCIVGDGNDSKRFWAPINECFYEDLSPKENTIIKRIYSYSSNRSVATLSIEGRHIIWENTIQEDTLDTGIVVKDSNNHSPIY